MNSLPISASPASSNAKPAPAAEASAQGAAFGEVLAQQVAENTPENNAPESAGETSAPLVAIKAKSAEEIFEQLNDARPANSDSQLPNSLLATLVPLTQNTPPSNAVLLEQTDRPAQTATESLDLGAKKTVPSTEFAAAAASNRAAPTAVGAEQATTKKDAMFAGMLALSSKDDANLLNNKDNIQQPVIVPTNTQPALQASLSANVMPAQLSVNTPVTQREWGDEFSQKITWIATSKEQSAELHLNPPQLGPMDVVLKVSGDQATALFTSPHAAVREAIEQALPKLREMLADSGIMLGNATVSDQASRQTQDGRDGRNPTGRNTQNHGNESSNVANLSARVSPIRRHNGIVDTFA